MFKTIGAVIGVIVLVAGIILGGWAAGWWFRTQNISREARIIQQGYSNQLTMSQQVQQKVSEVYAITAEIPASSSPGALKAQRAAIAGIACSDYSQISAAFQNSSGEGAWAAANCQGGILSPSSAYFTGGSE